MTTRCALLLCAALLPAVVVAEADPPLPAAAEAARLHGDLKVISKALHVKPDNEASTVESCKNWKLSDAQVAEFFRKAEPISGEVFHAFYYVLPCDYTGKVSLAGETYEFVINGGAYGNLITTSKPVVARTFGCRYACEQMVLFKHYPKEGEEP
jgi:hypothetical protein